MKQESDSPNPDPPSWPEYSSRHTSWRGRDMRRHRPPWWPENEEWPPKRWRYMRGKPFFRRMGCFFFAFAFLAFMGLLGILRLILTPFIDFHGAPLARPDTILLFGAFGFILLMLA